MNAALISNSAQVTNKLSCPVIFRYNSLNYYLGELTCFWVLVCS